MPRLVRAALSLAVKASSTVVAPAGRAVTAPVTRAASTSSEAVMAAKARWAGWTWTVAITGSESSKHRGLLGVSPYESAFRGCPETAKRVTARLFHVQT